MDDPWCARLAALHLVHLVETGEDMEKDLVTVPAADLKKYAGRLGETERSAVRATYCYRTSSTLAQSVERFCFLAVPGAVA